MRAVLTIGALLLVIAGLWWAAATSGDSDRAPATSETAPAVPPAPVSTSPTPTPSEPSRPVATPPPTAAPNPPPAPAPPPTAAAELPAVNVPVPPPERQGPFDRLKEQFASEPRDSAAQGIESHIQEAFRDPAIPPGVLTSVLCRKTVCKLQVRWTEEHNTAWMLGLTKLMPDLSTDLAFSPGSRDSSGNVPIEVYWGRKPGGAGH
jgi:hypothetical protein